jgi:hypothetical protein
MARELDDQIKDNGDVYFKSIFREKRVSEKERQNNDIKHFSTITPTPSLYFLLTVRHPSQFLE